MYRIGIDTGGTYTDVVMSLDSAGPGKFRGGFAQKRKWKVLGYEAQFFHTCQKSEISPPGIIWRQTGEDRSMDYK